MKFKTPLLAVILIFIGFFQIVSVQAQRQAIATPTVANGFVIAVTVTDGGAGYTDAPKVAISGGGGSGAIAIATILNGAVDKVIVQNAGFGYIGQPVVIIDKPPKQPFSDGLVAYYPFNGNANDESGNGDNGQVMGAKLTTDRFGRTDSAYSFDATQTATIKTAGKSIPEGSKKSKTFSCWFHATSPNGVMWSAGYLGEGTTICGRLFYVNNAYVGLQVGLYSSSYHEYFPSQSLLNAWHQYVVVVDQNNNISAYLDGVRMIFQTSAPPGTLVELRNAPFYIGYWSGQYFTGSIDDVRIYDRILLDQEVEDLYNYEAPKKQEQHTLRIQVKTVKIIMRVTINKKYQLEASNDLKIWEKVGNVFTASASEISQEFNVDEVGRYFRLNEVP